MKVRFQADNDLNQIIVKATVRSEPGIDFKTAHAAGLHGLNDLEVLARAAAEGRVLVSHDQKTMPRHFAEFIQTAVSSGVLIAPQKMSINKVIDDLLLIWMVNEAEEWVNRIRILPL
ncbi:MAG: DUF5615 family PIN-like protein [Acidobacteria bacterium]|nr:DUF5615 family PIN-like protein [Acidobacteriota bacterium]